MKLLLLFSTLLLLSCASPDNSDPFTSGTASPNFAEKSKLTGSVGESNAQIILYKNSDSTVTNDTATNNEYNTYYSENTTSNPIDTIYSDDRC